jgi:hypothetical protein
MVEGISHPICRKPADYPRSKFEWALQIEVLEIVKGVPVILV